MENRGKSHHLAARVASRASLALVGLFALLLAACSTGGGSGPTLAQNQTFTWSYINASAVGTPQTGPNPYAAVLDPSVVTNYIDSTNITMMYSGLVTLNSSTLQIVPDAAKKIDVDPTGTVYTFHLRDQLFFSDGQPITAQDFAYSINRAMSPNLCTVLDAKTYGGANSNCFGPAPGYLSMILGADKLAAGSISTLIGPGKGLDPSDAHTLLIRLAYPAAYFLEALSYPTSDPVEKLLVDKYPGGTWVNHLNEGGCSGPFMVKAYIPGKELQLKPNPYWENAWGKHLALTEVDRPILSSQDTEYANYHAQGNYDFTDVPSENYAFAVGQSDFHEIPSLTTDYFGVNFKLAPFTDLRIRQAFDLALNKQALIDRVYNGGAIPTNHIVPEGMPGYNPQLTGPDGTESVTGNTTKATALLGAAQQDCKNSGDTQVYCPFIDNGTKSQPIYLSAYTITDATQRQIATIATQTWSQVLGLNVQIKAYQDLGDLEYGTILHTDPVTHASDNPAQMWSIGWIADYPDPQDWLSLQFATTGPYNFEYISDAHLDTQMAQADKDQNTTRRMSEYHAIEQAVVSQCAWIPIDQEKTAWRLRTWVHGFGFNEVLLMEDIDWPNVYITSH